MASKVKKNYLYNLFYQILLVIVPVVTTPYISRVLGSEKIGIWSFTFSIVTYFTLVGSLGVALYGQREIARYQDDAKKRTEAFWQINIIKWITLSLSLVIYYFTCIQNTDYGFYYAILLIEIASSFFDISWFFRGLENFKTVTIRNTIIKLVSVASVFIFVHQKEDLWIYILIHVLANLLGNLSLWVILPKYLNKTKKITRGAKKHIVPILMMFIPQAAIQVYTVLDKSMLGFLYSDISENGIYEQSQNIIKIALALVTSLGTVMMPRIANLMSKNDKEEIKVELEKSFHLVWFLAIPICFGIIAVSPNLVPWFLGEDFLRVIPVMQIGSILAISIGLSNVTGTQYLVPTGKENKFTVSIIAGALTNVIGNFILISNLGAVGAIIASVSAETVVFLVQYHYTKKEISPSLMLKNFSKCFIAGLIMLACTYPISIYLHPGIINTGIVVIVGVLVYGISLLIMKEIWAKQYFDKALGIIRHKK